MTRQKLRQLLSAFLPANLDFAISRPPNSRFGEFSTNAPLRAACVGGPTPVQIGETLREKIAPQFPGRIELVKGHLNFFMSDTHLHQQLESAAREGAHFGAGDLLAGARVLVEFVSTDPNGPLPFSAGRSAALGEAICRLLENQGAKVTREFYLNDATSSSKIQLLGEGVAAWYASAFGQKVEAAHLPSDAFVRGIASEMARSEGAKWLGASPAERLAAASNAALEAAVRSQTATLERFGVRFDEWVSESRLRAQGRLESALETLAQNGATYEREGALWLQTTRFGDDTDRVLKRQNGTPTYFAGDIAYHLWKFERGFDRVLNIWSAEHRPYIARTQAALRAAGIDDSRFEFLVCENAVLKRDGVPLRLGAGGGALLLDEEIEELGGDALKYFFLQSPAGKVAEVDLEIAQRDDESNPAYSVGLLPSRLARLRREVEGQLSGASNNQPSGEFAPGERELARLVALWPDTAQNAASERKPEQIAAFALQMSGAARELLGQTRPGDLNSAESLTARLELLRAAQNVAQNALRILGIEARERF